MTATGATLAFDATGGGKLASQILTCMEAAASATAGDYSRYGSAVHKQVYIYGSLDRGPTELTRNFGMAWSVGGWLLAPFLQRIGLERMAALRSRVAAELTTTFASSYSSQVSLAGALDLTRSPPTPGRPPAPSSSSCRRARLAGCCFTWLRPREAERSSHD